MQRETIQETLRQILRQAKHYGADSADVIYNQYTHTSVNSHLKKIDQIERAETNKLGLRVFVGKKQAVVSTSDVSQEGLSNFVQQAVKMANAVPEDQFCGIASPDQIIQDYPKLDLCDQTAWDEKKLIDLVIEAESAALSHEGITNSDGAQSFAANVHSYLAASNGFEGDYSSSFFGYYVCVLAGEGQNMVRDYEYTSKTHAEDVMNPTELGNKAALKTLRRANARKIPSTKAPVIFDPSVSRSLLGQFATAINGASILRGSSFLRDKMNEKVFSDKVQIIDDPLRDRGLNSTPFDIEGCPTQRRQLIENGYLTSWLLDLRSARALDLETTGHAKRSAGGTPQPAASNIYIEPGKQSPEEMMKSIGTGLLVTDTMGYGANPVTGDYSQAAFGFWIENGEIAYPVNEITIAGHIQDMFLAMEPANDLEFRYGCDAPSLFVGEMTIAGS